MQGRPLIMLALAGTLGLGAMVMSRRMIGSGDKGPVVMRDVLVAVRDLKAEEVVKPDMVKTVQMAESSVPVGAFAAAGDVVDRWVNTIVLEGEPVVERKLGPKGSPPGLVAKIPTGMRAFAVEVNEQSGVSGFILPGHRVDVVKIETGDKETKRGETILQDVLVLAAGQVFARSEEKTLQSRTVTLAVNPDDVDLLVAAKAKGVLSLSLRGVNDHEVVERPKPPAEVDSEALAAEKQKRIELENKIASLTKQVEEENQRRAEAEAAKPKPAAPAPPPPRRVGYIYKTPGTRQVEFYLSGRGGLPSAAPDPSPRSKYPPDRGPDSDLDSDPDSDPDSDSDFEDGSPHDPSSLVQQTNPDPERYLRYRAR